MRHGFKTNGALHDDDPEPQLSPGVNFFFCVKHIMNISPSHSKQGSEGTCLSHALSKVIITNVICVIHPQEKTFPPSCNRFLITDEPNFKSLSKEECTPAGYFKLLWFWILLVDFSER